MSIDQPKGLSEEEMELINKIFSEMNVKMYNISFNIFRDKSNAEDALAQTFLKIIENIKKISILPCHEIEAYCVTILKNETSNIIRKRKNIVNLEDESLKFYKDAGYNLEDDYINSIDKERLTNCIGKLSKEDKGLLNLRLYNDMKFKDISELLSVKEETHRKRWQRVLEKIRECFR